VAQVSEFMVVYFLFIIGLSLLFLGVTGDVHLRTCDDMAKITGLSEPEMQTQQQVVSMCVWYIYACMNVRMYVCMYVIRIGCYILLNRARRSSGSGCCTCSSSAIMCGGQG